MKLCSNHSCTRHHDTKYKWCETCLETARRSQKKRKRLAAQLDVPDGMRLCKGCSRIKPIIDFTSKMYRREKLTTTCQSCRESQSKSQKNPTTSNGACRTFWTEWKKEQTNLSLYHFEFGKQCLENSNQDAAISAFKQALRVSEQCLQAYLSLGDAYLESGKQKQALKTWKTGYQKTGNKSCLVRSQIALRDSENYQELLHTYEETLEASEEQSLLVLLLSTFYLEHGLEDKARHLLENNSPEHPLLHSLLLESAQHSGNGNQQSHFELTRDAVFALTL